MEIELASTVKFVLDNAAVNPSVYYWNIPQDFYVPAVYFPPPFCLTDGDTLNSYAVIYNWHIKFFHRTTQEAYLMAFAVMTALQNYRNVIQLTDDTGTYTGRGFRLNDPEIKEVDNGVYGLILSWRSPRPYVAPDVEKMMTYVANITNKGEVNNGK